MKFLSLALAAVLGLSEAKKSITGRQLKKAMQKGQFNKKSLLRQAKPYSKAAERKLEEEEFEITGEYSVQFDSCLSLTVADEDLFDEDLIQYAIDGDIVAEKSYIVFDICKTEECYYQEDDAKMSFITDVASFFQAFADFLPSQVENYCEGCQQNEDYCYGNVQQEEGEEEGEGDEEGEEEGEDEEGEDEEGDEEERKLARNSRRKLANNQVVEYINCDLCFEYECYDDENENENQGDDVVYEFEEALEWLDGLAECQEIEDENGQWNVQMYAGLICNAEGNGLEIGVFYNEDCTLYNHMMAYSSVMSYADSQYYSMSQEVVEYMFTNDFSCYQPEVVYTNPYEEQEEEEEEEQDDGEEEAVEAAEWCGNLFGGDFEARNLYDCGIDEDEEQNDDDQEEDEYLANYEWYSYQLSQDQLEDEGEVCLVVQALEGEYSTVYDKGNSGSLYDYTKNSSALNNRDGLSGGAVAAIVILVLGAVGAGAYFANQGKSSSDKKAPLINEGSMA